MWMVMRGTGLSPMALSACAISAPTGTSGRGPTRGVRIEPAVVAESMMQASIGRKARPVWTGVKPRLPTRK